eukprot:TRINITY_DN1171_c0_g1_i5.p1 TRINITY_DN1171_c0_g1~~TRINITY_DN1171_c0_g1_i5.p1  ORF type:complete len:363 (+),score=62.50 TRINITY_DN1171_c0_g1_i5:51-1139(+)
MAGRTASAALTACTKCHRLVAGRRLSEPCSEHAPPDAKRPRTSAGGGRGLRLAPTHSAAITKVPLADKVRPQTLAEYVGQEEVLGEGTPLRTLIDNDSVPSLIMWGPPGVGKTTLARLIARSSPSAHFVQLSAAACGLAEVRKAVEEAAKFSAPHPFAPVAAHKTRTIIFLDEIHRFNKLQQDFFLPHVESGLITLIGATTENPSFEVNAALLSRCRVVLLKRLSPENIATIVTRAMSLQEVDASRIPKECLDLLANTCDGDARVALNTLETLLQSPGTITFESTKKVLLRTHLLYDKTGEEHYNLISALHKSMRGSDVDASLYWLGYDETGNIVGYAALNSLKSPLGSLRPIGEFSANSST